MAAGSIVVDLLMKTGSFETDTKRAEARLKSLEREAKQVGAAIGAAFVAAAAATAYFVKQSIDAADASSKNAQAVGLSVEAYTSLAFAADLSGISQEEMGTSLTKLARQASDAAGGSKTAAAGFKSLGIELKNADGSIKDTDKLLTEIAGKFKGMADGAEKTALATEIFGRAGARMIPLLNQGADGIEAMRREAAELGLVLDTQTARAAEQFNDDLTRLGGIARGFGHDLMRIVLPTLTDLTALLVEVAKEFRATGDATSVAESIFRGVLNVFQVLAVVGSDLVFVLKATGREIGAVAAQAVALAKLDIRGFRAISTAVMEDAERARAELDRFQARIMALGTSNTMTRMAQDMGLNSPVLNQPGLPRAPTAPSGGAGKAGGGAKAADDAQRYLDNLQRQLQATQDLSVEETLLADIRAGRLGKVSVQQEAELRATAAQIDQAREQLKLEREQAKEREQMERELAQIYEQTRTPIEKLNIELARLAKLREVAGADQDALARAEFDAWERYEKAIKKTGDEMDEFARKAAENFQTFLGGALADAFEGNFKDIGKNFTRMINRMVAEAIAADIARRMFGSAASGGSGEGWIGEALAWAGSIFGGAKASGGDVMPGREYWVGENGPEKFRPRSMGSIVPAGAAAGGARSFSQTLNINVQGQVNSKTATQIGAEAGRALRRANRMNG
jgi:hypothetical protein